MYLFYIFSLYIFHSFLPMLPNAMQMAMLINNCPLLLHVNNRCQSWMRRYSIKVREIIDFR